MQISIPIPIQPPKVVSFTVPNQPVVYRERAVFNKAKGYIMSYLESRARAHRDLVRKYADTAMQGAAPITGDVRLSVAFFMQIPDSASKARKEALEGAYCVSHNGDRTNLLKLCEDALKGIVMVDDEQVVDGQTAKFWSKTPRTEI